MANPQPAVAVTLKVGEEQKVLQLDRPRLQMLFDDLQDAQKKLDALVA